MRESDSINHKPTQAEARTTASHRESRLMSILFWAASGSPWPLGFASRLLWVRERRLGWDGPLPLVCSSRSLLRSVSASKVDCGSALLWRLEWNGALPLVYSLRSLFPLRSVSRVKSEVAEVSELRPSAPLKLVLLPASIVSPATRWA